MTQIISKIEQLREQLNRMVSEASDHVELYELSTELDIWITRYYKQQISSF